MKQSESNEFSKPAESQPKRPVDPARVEVLGPFRFLVDGTLTEVSRPQVRTILAVLAISDEPLPGSSLIQALWPQRPPADPQAALRTVLSRARSVLGPHAGLLHGDTKGYQLDAASDWSDFTASSNSDREMSIGLEQLAKLWRGQPFGSLVDSPRFDAPMARAHELHTKIRRQLVGWYVEERRFQDAADLATELIGHDDEDEAMVCAAATSLASTGRKTAALELIQQTRSVLRDRGLDPSQALIDAEAAILLGATDLQVAPVSDSGTAAAAFVGRDKHLIHLTGRRSGDITLIEGESGIGKTALLDAFRARLTDAGHATVSVAAPANPSAPLEIFTELAHALFELGAGVTDEHSPALAVIAPDRAHSTNRPTSRDALIDGVAAFIIDSVNATGATILIDDAQWLDAVSVLTLTRIIDSGLARLVLASRPGQRSWLLGEAADRAEIVELGPLSFEESEALVRTELPMLGAHQSAALHDRSGGNPFFLRILMQLVHEGVSDDEGLPPVVLAAVQRRLATLSREARLVLQHAAVLGSPFRLNDLVQLHPFAEQGTADALEQGLISTTETPGTYEFSHAIVADAAYQLMPEGERVTVHDLAGRVLEASGAEPMTVWAHAKRAAEVDGDRAMRFSLEAMDQHLAAYAWEGAIECAQWGLAFQEGFVPGLFESHHRLAIGKARAELQLGVPDSHLQLIEAAGLAERAGDDEALVCAAIELCNSGPVALTGVDLSLVKGLVDSALAANVPVGESMTLRAAIARLFVYSPLGEFGQTHYGEAFAAFDSCDRDVQELILRNSEAGLANPNDFELAMRSTALLAEAADRNPELGWLAKWFAFRDSLITGDGDRLALTLQDLRKSAAETERRHAFVTLGQTFDMGMQQSWAESSMAMIHQEYERAETFANKALETGLEQLAIRGDGFGEGWVMTSYGLLLLAIRHGQGRLAELVDVVETGAPMVPAWRVAMVITNQAAGNTDRVRKELKDLTADRFAMLVPDPTWTAAMYLLAEPVAEYTDRSVCEQMYQMVEPFADRMSYSGLCTFGPMHDALAVLADALAKPETAAEHRTHAKALVQGLRAQSAWALSPSSES